MHYETYVCILYHFTTTTTTTTYYYYTTATASTTATNTYPILLWPDPLLRYNFYHGDVYGFGVLCRLQVLYVDALLYG